MHDELIERLRKQRPNGECVTVARLMDDAAREIERLTAEVRRIDRNSIHTCWDDCPRVVCMQRRKIEALREQVAELEAELGYHGIYPNPITPRDTVADSDGDDGA